MDRLLGMRCSLTVPVAIFPVLRKAGSLMSRAPCHQGLGEATKPLGAVKLCSAERATKDCENQTAQRACPSVNRDLRVGGTWRGSTKGPGEIDLRQSTQARAERRAVARGKADGALFSLAAGRSAPVLGIAPRSVPSRLLPDPSDLSGDAFTMRC
jgi:hypothetical protein